MTVYEHLFGVAPESLDHVEVNLASEQDRSVIGGMSHDGDTDGGNGLMGRPVWQSLLFDYSSCGSAQTSEFDQPQPLCAVQSALVDPKTTEAMEGVAAFAAAPSSFLEFTAFSSAAMRSIFVSILWPHWDWYQRTIDSSITN